MRDTLLANVGCLVVFQVSGRDSRELVWELGRERLSEDDIVGQPMHHCYVRTAVDKETLPTFSMTVAKPEYGDPQIAARIREAASAYTTPIEDIEAQHPERVELLTRYQEESRSLVEEEPAPVPSEPPPTKRKKQRSKLER